MPIVVRETLGNFGVSKVYVMKIITLKVLTQGTSVFCGY